MGKKEEISLIAIFFENDNHVTVLKVCKNVIKFSTIINLYREKMSKILQISGRLRRPTAEKKIHCVEKWGVTKLFETVSIVLLLPLKTTLILTQNISILS